MHPGTVFMKSLMGLFHLGHVTTYFVSMTYFILPDLFCINF